MSDQKVLEQAQKICRNLLDLDPPETVEKINEAIEKVSQLLSLSNSDKELLFSRLVEVTGVSQEASRILDNKKIEPWVKEKWSQNVSSRRFWRRYQTYLEDEKKIAPKVISRLDELTDNILDRMADPEAHDEFDKRGLVVGHVQSGKTSNYIGLITKAADAGYKLIIVLAGIHSSLRSQTQLRIDEGFLGYDTETSRSFIQSNNRIGVGRLDPGVPAHSLTSSALNGDFRKNVADTTNLYLKGTDPVIVVIKKNNSVLKNLIEWLSAKVGDNIHGTDRKIINDLPMLLIDDEADNASINISKSSVSSINGSIRALLCLFRKSAYVGYTATPYANVFIPLPEDDKEPGKGLKIVVKNKDYPVGEDLFPRDFIVNISPPSNYIGPEKFFGIVSEDQKYESASDEEDEIIQNPLPIHLYEPITDHQPKDYYDSEVTKESIRETNFNYIPDGHKKDDAKPKELPESLKKAIQYFILACAARRVRGQVNVHNSMLVHVTRFIDWQNHIALKVDEELFRLKNRIEFKNPGFLAELKALWEDEFIDKTEAIMKSLPGFSDSGMTLINWNELEQELLPAVTKIRVRAVHGSKLLGGLEQENIQPLDYYENQKKGLSVIAVGGNKLSRGLTLEGLTVSYYLRASKMYDTLMQMGRWFGYRPGYLDLCRLFTTGDLVSHYKHITAATEEMRAEFDRMWLLKKKPRDYGLKVRAHTGVLTITASNKFRYKKMMYFGFSGDLEETWQFDKTRKDFFEKNHLITQQFIEKLVTPDGAANESKHLRKQSFVWKGQNNFKDVIEYLTAYQSSQPSFHTGLLREYIEKQTKNNKLIHWTIALITNSSANDENEVLYGEQKVGLSFRKDDAEETSSYYELTKAHIIGNFHEYIDLNDDQLNKALEETKNDKLESGKETPTEHPSPLRIRKNRNETNALLLIYPLNPEPRTEEPAYSNVPIIGLAISFPYMENEKKVLYAVNEVFQEQLYGYPEELDMDDIDPDEDDSEKNNSNRKSSLNEKTFRSLIENSYQNVLKETDFQSGLVPYYPGTDELSEVFKSHTNVILTAEKASGLTSVPFYAEKEIQQFYLNEPTMVAVKTEQEFTENEHYIVGLKRSKYVTFCYHEQPAAFPDSCWVIRSEPVKARFLSTLFNSTLFGAWVRVNGEQKKDIYFIKNEVLYKFPLVYPEENQLWVYDNLYELLVSAGRDEQALGTGTIRSYFASILDALVFCTYFSESMQQEKKLLYDSLESVIPKDLSVKEKRAALAEELFKVLYDRDHPVRKTVYYLDSHEKVKKIKAIFIQ